MCHARLVWRTVRIILVRHFLELGVGNHEALVFRPCVLHDVEEHSGTLILCGLCAVEVVNVCMVCVLIVVLCVAHFVQLYEKLGILVVQVEEFLRDCSIRGNHVDGHVLGHVHGDGSSQLMVVVVDGDFRLRDV